MAISKMFIFEPKDIVNLLIHYTDGEIPLDSTLVNLGVNPTLGRFLGFEIESKDWDNFDILQLRYQGNRVMSWTKNDKVQTPGWSTRNDTPVRQ